MFVLLVTALIVVVIRLRRHQHAIPDGIRRSAHSLYGRVVRPKSTHSSATGNNYHDPDEIGAGGGREMYANPAYHADTKDPKVSPKRRRFQSFTFITIYYYFNVVKVSYCSNPKRKLKEIAQKATSSRAIR